MVRMLYISVCTIAITHMYMILKMKYVKNILEFVRCKFYNYRNNGILGISLCVHFCYY
jgi:hypothetical protein